MPKDFAISIIRTLRERGHRAYLAGGCVRDLLLNREPADYDVVTDALPDGVMRIFPKTYAVGVQFGVVLVPMVEGSSVIEISNSSDRGQAGHGLEERQPASQKAGYVEVATFRHDVS